MRKEKKCLHQGCKADISQALPCHNPGPQHPKRQEVCDHGVETASEDFQKGVEEMVQVQEQEWGM